MQIDRQQLLLAVQRALLGAIGSTILAICVNSNEDGVELIVFTEGQAPDDQLEALEIAATEISADFLPPVAVSVRTVVDVMKPVKADGVWVFLRLGCSVVK